MIGATEQVEKITRQLRQVIASGGHAWSFDGQELRVPIGEDGRHHRVHLAREGENYVLTCAVLGRAEVTRTTSNWNELARLAWQRNAEHELVSFGFDRHDRLIGQIQHPVAHLDSVELELYIHALTSQCDRFEYLLTGKDLF